MENIFMSDNGDFMMMSPDNNVNEICNEFVSRSKHGFEKYGVTTERTEWTQLFIFTAFKRKENDG